MPGSEPNRPSHARGQIAAATPISSVKPNAIAAPTKADAQRALRLSGADVVRPARRAARPARTPASAGTPTAPGPVSRDAGRSGDGCDQRGCAADGDVSRSGRYGRDTADDQVTVKNLRRSGLAPNGTTLRPAHVVPRSPRPRPQEISIATPRRVPSAGMGRCRRSQRRRAGRESAHSRRRPARERACCRSRHRAASPFHHPQQHVAGEHDVGYSTPRRATHRSAERAVQLGPNTKNADTEQAERDVDDQRVDDQRSASAGRRAPSGAPMRRYPAA